MRCGVPTSISIDILLYFVKMEQIEQLEAATDRELEDLPLKNEEKAVLYSQDEEHGDSFSFAGCGFLGSYHLGVAAVLKSQVPHLLEKARFGGASAGALIASLILLDIPLGKSKNSEF
jgi:hypothetical protein